MQFATSSSLSSPSHSSFRVGTIPVVVPILDDPDSVPSGIRLHDPSPVMVETRSGDLRRLEERFTTAIAEFSDSAGTRDSTMKMSIQNPSADLLQVEDTFRKAMGDLFSRLDESNRRLDESIRRRYQADRRCDRTLKELRDNFTALDVQNTELMAKLKAGNGGNSAAASIELNVRAQCFATHQSEPRDKSVEECIPRFPAEISNFIGSNFSNPMVELRSLKQVGMVSDYITHFKTLLEKVEITELYAVHLFVSGLNYHVQNSVRMFEPKSLVHAFALARLQESALNFRANSCENEDRKMDSVRESILISLEIDEERSSGKEVCVEKKGGKNLAKRRALAADASDLRFKEPSAEFLALQMQKNELTNRFVATRGCGALEGGPPRAPYFATCQRKVGFPIFSGEDLAGWVIRCDHFFAVNLTPEDSKVRLAVINFEGRALQWFQLWSQYQDNAMATPWILLLQELEGCFGDKNATEGINSECGEATDEGNIGNEAMEDEFSSDDSYENVEVTEMVGLEQTDTGMVMNLKEKESLFEGNFELMNSTSVVAQETETKFNSLEFKEELHSITTPEIAILLSNNSSSTLGGGSNPDMDDVDVDDAVWIKSIGVLQRKILDIGHNVVGYPRADGLAVAEVKGADLLSRVPAPHLEFGVAIHTASKVLHKWKSKNVRKAQEIFYKMRNDQFCPDLQSYSILIEGWGRAPSLPKARKIFNEMVDSGCKTDTVTYGIMVDILCKAECTDEAVGVVNEMELRGCQPTSFIYSVLMHTYGIENRIEDGIDTFLQMERNKVKADVAVYNSLISAFCKVNKLENAYNVVDEMDKKGVGPNSRTCNILINSLIGRGETDCSKLLHRRPFFKLSEVILEFGIRMNGGIKQALHKIEVPKHRTERIFRVFKGMFQFLL